MRRRRAHRSAPLSNDFALVHVTVALARVANHRERTIDVGFGERPNEDQPERRADPVLAKVLVANQRRVREHLRVLCALLGAGGEVLDDQVVDRHVFEVGERYSFAVTNLVHERGQQLRCLWLRGLHCPNDPALATVRVGARGDGELEDPFTYLGN